MNKSILTHASVVLTLLALSAGSAFAGGTPTCQPIYGGGESCIKTPKFELNKTVKDPKSGLFVDNLGVGSNKYKSTETVAFKLTIKNTTGETLKNIVIKDTIPDNVDFVDGMGGKFDSSSKTLTIALESLAKDEIRDFYVNVKVKGVDKLPSDQSTTCVVNRSTATVDNVKAEDNSQFCIEKGEVKSAMTQTTSKGGVATVSPTPTITQTNPAKTKGGLPVYPPTKATTTPPTGPESIALFGLIPTAISGFILRRKAK